MKFSPIISCLLLAPCLVCAQAKEKAKARDWYMMDPSTDSIVGISLAKAYAALNGKTSRTVVVAVIDNGVDIDHPDLKNKIWSNTKEIPGNGLDDDHNGYADDVHGWNFRGAKDGTTIENERASSTQLYVAWKSRFESKSSGKNPKKEETVFSRARQEYLLKKETKDSIEKNFSYNTAYNSDDLIANGKSKFYGTPNFKLTANLSHGTHVAGIIAAERGNQIGIDGIADRVLIMPILATTAVGDERDKDIANAIRYAVDNGAQIINMSFSKLFSENKKWVDEAIKYSESKNVLLVHAAGNDGMDIDSIGNYHFPMPIYEDGTRPTNFINVGWSRALFDYRLAHPYSDYGVLNVDLFSPGSDIYSTVPNGLYDYKSGSSMSAPVVTGVAALLLSYFPELTAKKLKQVLLASTFKPDQLVNRPKTKEKVKFSSLSSTGGIVNAFYAVKVAIESERR